VGQGDGLISVDEARNRYERFVISRLIVTVTMIVASMRKYMQLTRCISEAGYSLKIVALAK
jgi:hypothetical protein